MALWIQRHRALVREGWQDTYMSQTGRRQQEGQPRPQALRDAITVEIIYSVFAGAFVAALIYFLVAGPALLWSLGSRIETALFISAATASALGFTIQVSYILLKLRTALKERSERP
ncbi:DUF6332 family protein [Streptomyces sp. B1866]|uniref:DUF6332 family protein n=1 Tax=Streptomyces sp. B1866 TaxID=3075431 RepID=UPI0034D959CE